MTGDDEERINDTIDELQQTQVTILGMLVKLSQEVVDQQKIIMGQQEMLVEQHGLLLQMCEKAFGIKPEAAEKPRPDLRVVQDEGSDNPSAA